MKKDYFFSVRKMAMGWLKRCTWQFLLYPLMLVAFMVIGLTAAAQNVQGVAPVQTPMGGFGVDGDAFANTPAGYEGVGDWFFNAPGGGGGLYNPDPPYDFLYPYTYQFVDAWGRQPDYTTFTSSNKINDHPATYTWGLGNVPNKNEIQNVGVHFTWGEPSLGGDADDLWCLFAADREVTNGSSYIDFEFLQNTLSMVEGGTFTTEGPHGGRTVGDVLVTVEFTNGGPVATVVVNVWEQVGAGYQYVVHPNSEFTGAIFATVNTAPTTVPFDVYGGNTYVVNQWCEGAVNLSALFNLDEDPCFSLATLFVRTRTSGSSAQSELKDIPGAPIQLNLDLDDLAVNCPNPATVDACADVATAYQNWKDGFSYSGGIGTIVDNLGELPETAESILCGGQISFTYYVSDDCIDSLNCSSTFTVTAPDPIVINCPTDVDLPECTSLDDIAAAYASWVGGFTSSGDCRLSDNIDQIPALPENVRCVGADLSFTYEVTGDCFGTETCTSTFKVAADETAPVITADNEDDDLGCNPTAEEIEAALGGASATDNCDDEVDVDYTDGDVISDGCMRSKTRTFTAEDECGNAADEVTVTVTWKWDTEAPVITADNEDDDLGCNPTAEEIEAALGGATAMDGCDGEVDVDYTDGDVISDGCMRSKTRTFTAEDECGNAADEVTVTVTWKWDTEAPVITADNEDDDLGCNPTAEEIEAALGGATAMDNCDGEVDVDYTDGDVISDGCMRSKTRTFTAEDECGNTADEVTVTVTWKWDMEAPVITADNEDDDLGCNPTAEEIEAALGGATAMDNCDGEVDVDYTDGDVISDGCMRSKTRTFTAEDECGNTADEVTVTVTWKWDMEAPVITADNEDDDLGCNPTAEEIEAALGGATAMDNCDGEVDVAYTDGDVMEDGCMRSKTRTFTAEDECGNAADEVTVTVTWKYDLSEPVLQGTFDDLVFECSEPVVIPDPVFEDECDGTISELTVTVNGEPETDLAGYMFPEGDTEVCFYVEDECGNPASVCITVTVLPCGEDFCTLTQGFYGNDGGLYCDGRTTTELLTDLLDTDLVIGCPGHSYTIPAGSAACVIGILPGGGSSSVLNGDYNCGQLVNKQGTLNNSLLAQTITLGLNLRLDADLADLTITPYFDAGEGVYVFWTSKSSICKGEEGEASPVGEWLPFYLPASVLSGGSVNVGDLYAMANDALCGTDVGVSLGDLAMAVGAINDGFDECAFLSTTPPAEYFAEEEEETVMQEMSTFNSFSMTIEKEGIDLIAYPNPFTEMVTFQFVPSQDGRAVLEIFNSTGAKLSTVLNQKVLQGVTTTAQYQPAGVAPGVLIYSLTLNGTKVSGQLILNK